MIRKELIKTIIVDSQRREVPEMWERSLQVPLDSGKIITLSGVRRSGKTYHLFKLMAELTRRGIKRSRIVYINFEDERLRVGAQDLDLILESFRELYPTQQLSDCYFFFDEIQEVDGWEKFVGRMYASISTHIYITGSNSTLLSKEIASALRGRTITFEVYPLSFSEYADVVLPDRESVSSEGKASLIHCFDRFMHEGGFPELVRQHDDRLKEKILQEYFHVMVLRDLIERYHISNTAALKYFCKRLVGMSAGMMSVNKIYHELKSQGYRVSKDMVYLFQGYAESIYLNRSVYKYSHSVAVSQSAQKKTYVVDQGLGVALDYKFSQDKGRQLETAIALELVKQGKQIAYEQNGFECDFVMIEKGEVRSAMQVAFDVSDQKSLKREVKGLVLACKNHRLTEGMIVTHDHEEYIKQEGIRISVVPAWKYANEIHPHRP